MLVIGLETGPLTLDPRRTTDAYSAKISRLIHNGLFKVSARLELIPDLIESYEFKPPQTYLFKLRSGILFHNGQPLTAQDVLYTFESIRDPQTFSPFRGTFEKIQKMKVMDPLILQIELKEPFSPFLSAMTVGIIPEKGDPTQGTGPFQLERFTPAEGVWLRRNDRYFDGPAQKDAKVQKVFFKVIPDDNLRLLELKNHSIDLLQNNIPPALLGIFRKDSKWVIERTEGINESYLGMNLRSGPLQKKEVRQAMTHALNLPVIIEYRMNNMARPATGLLAPIHWAYEEKISRYSFDPRRARFLLDEAGYPDPDGQGPQSRFTLTYKTSTKRDRIGLARLVARYLRDVGIEIKILPFEWGTLFHDLTTGNFELYSLTWVGITEPDIYYYAFHSSQMPPVGGNRGGYQNETIDTLTEEGRRVFDQARRKEVYSKVQKALSDELPVIPLWYEDNFAVFSRNIQGVQLRPDGAFDWVVNVSKQ